MIKYPLKSYRVKGIAMSLDAQAAINDCLDQGKPFEVKYDNGVPAIGEAKGISKVSLSPDEVKNAKIKKVSKRKVMKEQKVFVGSASEIFLKNKVPFKVTFGTDESIIRFDLDHYIRLSRNKEEGGKERCIVLGFSSLDEQPVALIKEFLSTYPNVRLLTPKR
jgi:hypothetical protein